MTTTKKIPALRFPEFEGEWEDKRIGECATKVGSGSTPKGGEKVYTTSGIPFIRSQNVNDNQLKLDDITFIPEAINNKMQGTIVMPLDILLNITGASIGRSCVVPKDFERGNVNQHVCIIRLNEKNSPFFFQAYLSSFKGQKAIERSQVGSGREGLNFQSIRKLSIQIGEFSEQQKIASFLTAIDDKIQQLTKKKSLLEQYKKGVMQQIFNQQIRFKDDDGNDYLDWEEKRLAEVLKENKKRNTDNNVEEVFSVAKSKGVINQLEHLGRSYAAEDVSNYKVAFPNDIIYTKSPTSDFPFGIIKQNKLDRKGIVSVLYAVYTPINKHLGNFIDAYFSSWVNTYNYLSPLVRKGAKNTMNIGNDEFLNGTVILLPVSVEEQEKISSFLNNLEAKIDDVNHGLEQMRQYKKGLLQQMLV